MAYTRTGRPPGRPKTKEYVTLMARVPQDTADQAKRYAARHRQTISEVLRDGLDLLLQDTRYAPLMSDTNSVPEIMSDMKYVAGSMSDMNGSAPVRENMSDTNDASEGIADTLPIQKRQEIVSAINGVEEITSDTNSLEGRVSDIHAVPEIMSDTNSTPAYDTKKFTLGKLCPQGHAYHGTGKTLLRLPKYVCPQCDAQRARDRRQAKRLAPSQE